MRTVASSAILVVVVLMGYRNSPAASGVQDAKGTQSDVSKAGDSKDRSILEEMLAAHNKVRAEEHLPPLTLEPRLTAAARAHARDMAERAKLSHEGNDGSDPKARIRRAEYRFRTIGENVAAGQETVAEAMGSWLESPPHRENILGEFTEMGAGVARATDGREFWCIDFGRPMPAIDATGGPPAMISALNRARAVGRKSRVRADRRLGEVAARFAGLAASAGKLEARDRDGRTPFQVLEAEGYHARRFATTIASGEAEPGKVVAGWLKEKRDREALLSAFDRAGVGVAADADGVPYWVLLLAKDADH